MIYDGLNGGTVEVLDAALIIRRKGLASILTQGLKGEKRIPFSSISSVQFKEPGITTGYIQFGIIGGIEGRGGVFNATTDENTVLFTAKALPQFRQLRDVVESRIGQSAGSISAPAASSDSFVADLTRLADLRDRGVLTEEEFAEEKARLRNPRNAAAAPTINKFDTVSTPIDAKRLSVAQTVEAPNSTLGRKLGIGCLVIIGILVGLIALGSSVGSDKSSSGAGGESGNVQDIASILNFQNTSASEPFAQAEKGAAGTILTAPQNNAVKSAEQYLAMSGFSRKGLIDQLSSNAGEGYSVADATAAVDSLSVDWNENATRSAKQYLNMTGFSCSGLIQQLSSSAGDKYTRDQASYGARQAGAC